MPRTRAQVFAVVATVLMLGAGIAMTSVAATEHGGLDLEVEQDDNFNVTITVTENETAVEGANVTVEPVPPGRTYVDNGTHVTDTNGTVELAAPEDDLLVDITVEHNNSTLTEQTVFQASEEDEEEAEEPDANATENFGQLIKAFVHSLDASFHPRGLYIAPFAIEYNPGNAPAHAGPPSSHPLAPEGNLTYEVNQSDENATVTVWFNDSPVENATVEIEALGQGQAFSVNETTDENGTVTFDLPARPTMTTITVTYENDSVTDRLRLNGADIGPPGQGNDGGGPGNGNGPPGHSNGNGPH